VGKTVVRHAVRVKRLLILPAVLLAMSTIAACGDDDESSDDTTEVTVRDTTEQTIESTTADTTEEMTGETADDTSGSTAAGGTTGGSSAAAGEVCESLEVISDYDKQSSQVMAGGGDHEEVLALFQEATPTVVAAYEDVAAAEPELADAASTLSEFTQDAAGAAEGTTNLSELATAILELPNVNEAAEAGMMLNTYAEENCGFSTGNQSG
jgi:hypothetical protein